jgi:EF hand
MVAMAVLSLLTTAATPAADATPVAPVAAAVQPAPAQDVVQQLDEIVVHGKRLVKAINDAEDDFYQLFNQLNKDDRYDTSCVYLNANPDDRNSRIQTRVCMPGFVADAMADWAQWKIRCQPPLQGFDEFSCLDRNSDRRISWQEATARTELEADFQALDQDHDGFLSRQEFAAETSTSQPAYQPPPPQLVLMEGSKDWYAHMMQVINSDPRLQQKAGHLDDLYRELVAVQQQYGKARDDLPVKTVKPNLGPRIH